MFIQCSKPYCSPYEFLKMEVKITHNPYVLIDHTTRLEAWLFRIDIHWEMGTRTSH